MIRVTVEIPEGSLLPGSPKKIEYEDDVAVTHGKEVVDRIDRVFLHIKNLLKREKAAAPTAVTTP